MLAGFGLDFGVVKVLELVLLAIELANVLQHLAGLLRSPASRRTEEVALSTDTRLHLLLLQLLTNPLPLQNIVLLQVLVLC